MEPDPARVMVPPAVIAIPVPLSNIPDVKLRLVIARLELVDSVEPARLSVRVPRPVPVKPTSAGIAPDPLMMMMEALVTDRSPDVRAKAPLIVRVLLPIARSPSV